MTGSTLYAVLDDATSGESYGASAWDAGAGAWSTYAHALTESGTGDFKANMPTTGNATPRLINVVIFLQAGGSPASTDSVVGTGQVDWSGAVPAKLGDKTGFALSAAGLDAVPVETGVNARQALSPILASAAGVISGAGTGTVLVKGGNVGTTRVTATTDVVGNRTAVTLVLPA